MEFSGAKIIYVPLSEMLQCVGEVDVVFMTVLHQMFHCFSRRM
jgi:hypothetical protein